MEHEISIICGNSNTGKTRLAKTYKKSRSKFIDLLNFECFIDDLSNNNLFFSEKRKKYLLDCLNNIDDDITDILFEKVDDCNMLFIKRDKENTYILNEKPRIKFIIFIFFYLNSQNIRTLIIDNFECLFSGHNFVKVIRCILKEAFFNKKELVITTTQMSIFQSLCMNVKDNVKSKFLITSKNVNTKKCEVVQLSKQDLLYTINIIYNKNVNRSMRTIKDKMHRPMDEVEY